MPMKLSTSIDIATRVMVSLEPGSEDRRAIAGVIGCAIAIQNGIIKTPLSMLAICDKCMAIDITESEFCRTCGETLAT